MEIAEFKKLVADSPAGKRYANMIFTITLKPSKTAIELDGIIGLYEWAKTTLAIWHRKSDITQVAFSSEIKSFNLIIQDLVDLVANNEYSIGHNSTLYRAIHGKVFLFDPNSLEIDVFQKIVASDPSMADSAQQFLLNENFSNLNRDDFAATVHSALVFLRQKKIKVAHNEAGLPLDDIISANELRLKEYSKFIDTNAAEGGKKLEDFQASIQARSSKIDENIARWLEDYSTFQKGQDDAFSQLLIEKEKSLAGLEDLYQEKLRLEAPIDLWNARIGKLVSQGTKWTWGTGVLILVLVALLGFAMKQVTDPSLSKSFANPAIVIKWSILLIGLAVALGFAIKASAKMLFSTFHLKRDAEERLLLTYLYLSLSEKNAVGKEDRTIVLSSLFSRAETGLLKDDGSPTMASAVFDKVVDKKTG